MNEGISTVPAGNMIVYCQWDILEEKRGSYSVINTHQGKSHLASLQ